MLTYLLTECVFSFFLGAKEFFYEETRTAWAITDGVMLNNGREKWKWIDINNTEDKKGGERKEEIRN